jgi:thiol:disulfide interchange protein
MKAHIINSYISNMNKQIQSKRWSNILKYNHHSKDEIAKMISIQFYKKWCLAQKLIKRTNKHNRQQTNKFWLGEK